VEYLYDNQLQTKLCYIVFTEKRVDASKLLLNSKVESCLETSQMLTQTIIKRRAAIMRKSVIQFWFYLKRHGYSRTNFSKFVTTAALYNYSRLKIPREPECLLVTHRDSRNLITMPVYVFSVETNLKPVFCVSLIKFTSCSHSS